MEITELHKRVLRASETPSREIGRGETGMQIVVETYATASPVSATRPPRSVSVAMREQQVRTQGHRDAACSWVPIAVKQRRPPVG
jgi:hypothetical protein